VDYLQKPRLNKTPRVYAKNPGSGGRLPRVYAGQIVILHQVFAAPFKQTAPAGHGPKAIRQFPFLRKLSALDKYIVTFLWLLIAQALICPWKLVISPGVGVTTHILPAPAMAAFSHFLVNESLSDRSPVSTSKKKSRLPSK